MESESNVVVRGFEFLNWLMQVNRRQSRFAIGTVLSADWLGEGAQVRVPQPAHMHAGKWRAN